MSELKLYPAEQVGKSDIGRGIEIYQELVRKIMASKPRPESKLEDALNLSNIYTP